jgi:hypothetical protein
VAVVSLFGFRVTAARGIRHRGTRACCEAQQVPQYISRSDHLPGDERPCLPPSPKCRDSLGSLLVTALSTWSFHAPTSTGVGILLGCLRADRRGLTPRGGAGGREPPLTLDAATGSDGHSLDLYGACRRSSEGYSVS